MITIGLLLVRMLCDFFKPRPRLEAGILILRHQLNLLRQRAPRRRLHLRWVDRVLFKIHGELLKLGIAVAQSISRQFRAGSPRRTA
jgi:hypothetical protein